MKDTRPYCNCKYGFYGTNCEHANCTLRCNNGGVCYKSGEDELCRCPWEYIGKQCEQRYIHPETCPPPEYSNDMCKSSCTINEDCVIGQVCCKEGCSSVCREPRAEYCMHQGTKYPVNVTVTIDPCKICTCTTTGMMSCSSMQCGIARCLYGLQPVVKPDQCCPSCPDPDPPTITNCPSSVVVPLNTTNYTDFVLLNENTLPITARDFKGSKLQVIYTPDVVRHCHCSLGGNKQTSVQAYAVDELGNIATCTFRVLVKDPYRPRFLFCPDNVKLTDADVVQWKEPTYEDNVEVISMLPSHQNGRKFPVGIHRVNFSISDFDGNNATCEFTVTVVKAIPDPPSFRNCPTSVVYMNTTTTTSRAVLSERTTSIQAYDAAVRKLQVSYQPDFVDHCKCTEPAQDVHVVVAAATDDYGSTTTCTFKVIVRDVISPTFTFCPQDVYVTEGKAVVWRDPTYTDNVGVAGVSGWNRKSGDVFPVGNYSVSYEIWDYDKNKAMCEFKIFVTKEEPKPPTMVNCPSERDVVTLYTEMGSDYAVLTERTLNIEAYDADGNKLQVVYDRPLVTHCRCYGTLPTRVTAEASDAHGNVVTCRFAVIVKDTQKPVFSSCPPDFEIVVGDVVEWKVPYYKDNVAIAGMTQPNGTNGSVFPVGKYSMEYKIWDFDENYALCRFNITVKEAQCQLDCYNGGVCEMTDRRVSYCRCQQPYIGKQCEYKYSNPESCPAVQVYNYTCQTYCTSNRDCSGNQVCCKEGCSTLCREARVIYCQQDGRIFQVNDSYNPDSCTRCTCASTGKMVCATMSCEVPKCLDGRQPVSSPDQCCLTCPAMPPLPPLTISNCPVSVLHLNTSKDTDMAFLTEDNTRIQAFNSREEKLEVYFKPTFVRHCGCYESLLQETQVKAFATDENGNMVTCTFNVIVHDPFEPMFLSCPEDIYVFNDEIVRWRDPEASDNVKIAEKLCSSQRNGEIFEVGNHSVACTSWDYDGNTAACYFEISVSERGTAMENMPQGLRERSSDANRVELQYILPPVVGAFLIVLVALVFLYCCRRHIKSRLCLKSPTKAEGTSPPSYSSGIYAAPDDYDNIKPKQKKRKPSVSSGNTQKPLSAKEALVYHNYGYSHTGSVILDPPPYSHLPPAYSVSGSIKDVLYVSMPAQAYTNPGYETMSVHTRRSSSSRSSHQGSVKSARSGTSRHSSKSSKT